ncbi:MAG TPA: hypothetical protein VFN97_04620 [Actinospica sp.]|nr:hypothetical protein [Actinospica sp.]
MINHTMLVKFADSIPDAELDQFLGDIEGATKATGVLESFAARRHIRVPGEEQIPAFIASVVVQLRVADVAAFGALLSDPAVGEVFDVWRGRRPFEVAWVNHEVL